MTEYGVLLYKVTLLISNVQARMTAASAMKFVPRESFKLPIYFSSDQFQKAFPMHMAKAQRIMSGLVNRCDCVVEVHDARIPLTGYNSNFQHICGNKPRILVLNKIDLAEAEKTKILSANLESKQYQHILFVNSKEQHSTSIKKILPFLKNVFHGKQAAKAEKRGMGMSDLTEAQQKVLVCGIPNVGKSSFINSARRQFMRRGKATPTGKVPGITRSVMQTIKISESPKIYILDTPGIIPAGIPMKGGRADLNAGFKLALVGTFPDHVIGEDLIADYLLYVLNKQQNYSYMELCDMQEPSDDINQVLRAVAIKNGFIYSNNLPDVPRCSNLLIREFRAGRLGSITLDDPGLNLLVKL